MLKVDLTMSSDEEYNPYPFVLSIMEHHNWVPYDSLLCFVNTYQHSGFYDMNHSVMRQAYFKMLQVAPFSIKKQFPKEFYVHLENTYVRKYINQILNATDIPQYWTYCLSKQGDITVYNQIINNLTNAKNSYDVGFSSLSNVLNISYPSQAAPNGIFNRQVFEKNFGITWNNLELHSDE